MKSLTEETYFEKVAYIVSSDELQRIAEHALAEEIQNGQVDVIQIDLYHIRDEYERLLREGYGAIVARGGTYREISQLEPMIPIVEERVRSADLLEMAADILKTGTGILYVLLHNDTAYGFENMEKLLPERVRVMRYRGLDEPRRLLAEIPEGPAMVLANGRVRDMTDRKDLRLFETRTREYTIQLTVRTAYNLMLQMRRNASQVNVLNSVYNNIDEGIIMFRPDNTIVEINRQAERMLHLHDREAIGRDIYDLIEDMPPRKTDGSCSVDTPTTFTSRVGTRMINFSIYPFDFFRGTVRYMVIVQDVTKIQETERKIRMQLSKKGLIAKRTFADVITQEPVMEHVVDRAKRVAENEGSVLIYGESGTGKELFAQSIHNASRRRNGPFVAINCGALTDSLLESELFGYVGGSFTGARKEGKVGLFELAHTGTIFLDEINSMTLNLQTKILRVLEERQVMRVGSDYVIPLDIRVISASNSNLSEDVENGRFRRDLFFRLNTFEVYIPPLRERKADIPMLFHYYLKDICGHDSELDPAFVRQLEGHRWLGNVRELRSVALRYDAFGGDNSRGDILDTSRDAVEGLAAAAPDPGRTRESVPGREAVSETAVLSNGANPQLESETQRIEAPGREPARPEEQGNKYTADAAGPDSGKSRDTLSDTRRTGIIGSDIGGKPAGIAAENGDSAENTADGANMDAVPLSELSRVVEQIVIETLAGRGMTKSQIARELGISRQALYKKMKKESPIS